MRLIDLIREAATPQRKKAPKWANRWLYQRKTRHSDDTTFGPGERLTGAFPSREVAEQNAIDYITKNTPRAVAANGMIYLGPVQIGDE